MHRLLLATALVAVATALVAVTTASLSAALSTSETRRIAEAGQVLQEIHAVPDKDIPKELWDKASCVMVVPDLKKAAFIFGGEYGKGLLSCRQASGWSAPVFMRLEKGSWGLQIGAQEIDLVLLVMNREGIEKLLKNKVTLGAELSVAAGPVGRDARAGTDGGFDAEMLSYSRAEGLFAGINLSGGAIRADEDTNRDLYGAAISPRDVLLGQSVTMPAAAAPFISALRR